MDEPIKEPPTVVDANKFLVLPTDRLFTANELRLMKDRYRGNEFAKFNVAAIGEMAAGNHFIETVDFDIESSEFEKAGYKGAFLGVTI